MKIGLLDHMGYGNLGDAATQDAVITNISRRVPNVEIIGFSLVPQDTVKRHGIPCHPIRRSVFLSEKTVDEVGNQAGLPLKLKAGLKRNRLVYALARPFSQLAKEAIFWVRSYRILRTLDLLIVSGGGQLDDLWPDQPYTIFVFALLTRLARKKLYLLDVGVGPLRRNLDKVFTKWVCRLAHYRSVRDRDSQERLIQFGVRETTHVYSDVVYSLEVDDLRGETPVSSSRPTVGVNPTGFCDPRTWPRKDEATYQKYINKLFAFLLWLLDNGYDVRFFTTDFANDKYAIDDLNARLCSTLSSAPFFQAPSDGVRDVLKEMAKFDIIVTSKFHGIIFSHLLQKPVISLSYARKMDYAMKAVGQGDFSEHIEHFDGPWLKKTFSALIDQRSGINRQCLAAVEMHAVKLSQQFDSLFLAHTSETSTS